VTAVIIERARTARGHWWQSVRFGLLLTVIIVGSLLVPVGSASAEAPFSFDAGVFNPRQTKHRWWNNANGDAWVTGLVAVGVDDPDAFCTATVTRSWYVRQASGEREFHMIIEGDPFERCQIRVWLARPTAFRSSTTGVINPGGSVTQTWNNASTDQNIYVVGVVGSQPASGTCEFEVTSRYQTQPNGENEFVYTTTNVGSVACSAERRMVRLPVTERFDLGAFRPGGQVNLAISFATTTNLVVGGLNPRPVSDGVCRWVPGLVSSTGAGHLDFDYTNTAVTQWCGADATFSVL
jgi:hypothetical protein